MPFLLFILFALSQRIRHASSVIERLYVLSGFSVVAFYFTITGDMFTKIERAFFTGSFLGLFKNWQTSESKVPAASRYREKPGRRPHPSVVASTPTPRGHD